MNIDNITEREAVMATILFTGATGTVGSELAPLLEKEGHKLIYLTRASSIALLRLQGLKGDVLVSDITKPRAGIGESPIILLKALQINKLVNCAASVKFQASDAEEISQVNIDGVKNLLALAEELEIPEFHQVSTAYVTGDASYSTETQIDGGQHCRNIYESTKRHGELLVNDWNAGKHSTYRLGIVVGKYQTGEASTFNAYYVFMNTLWYLKQKLALKSKAELRKYREDGIYFDDGGNLVLPISIDFSPTSTLNLTPIDWTVDTLCSLIGTSTKNKIFHVVDPMPKRICWLNDISLRILGIKGFRYGEPSASNPKSLLSKIQRIFNKSTEQYRPYIKHECAFETKNVSNILGERYISFPEINESFLKRILNYAISVNFGRKPKSV